MGNLELLGTALGLAMDALAVSIACGAVTASGTVFLALKLGLLFGFFQAFMPLVGWLAGTSVADAISPYDHWVAFGLLAIVGGHMLLVSFRVEKETEGGPDTNNLYVLLLLAVATSIDALAVGLTLSLLAVPVVLAISIIGLVTFGASFSGVFMGRILGNRFENKAAFVGGIILLVIGTRILVDHLAGGA